MRGRSMPPVPLHMRELPRDERGYPYAGSMALLRSSTGEYRDLIQDQPVVIESRLS